jgi:hypothetical protein
LNIEATKRIEAAQARTKHVLTCADFDALAEIDRLAREMASPGSECNAPLSSHVVYVNRLPVHPLTLAHCEWLSVAAEWQLSDEEHGALALWIVTQPRIEDWHYDERSARAHARRFARRCWWTPADVDYVKALRYPRADDSDATGSEQPHLPAIYAMLCHEIGGTPDYWRYEASLDLIEHLCAGHVKDQEAQARAIREANKKALPCGPKVGAMKKLREACERLEEQWRKSA